MSSRRDFIKQSSLFAAGAFITKENFFKHQNKIGLQLYTVRNEMGKDAKATLAKIAQIGYKEVETINYSNGKWFGLTPPELSAVFKENGLSSPSGHTFPGGFFIKGGWEDLWKKAVEDSKTIGQEYIVIPWLEPNYRDSIDNFKKLAAELNKAAAIAEQSSLKLAYHNHDFEFADLNGQHPFEILIKETDPSLVKFEMDLYWVTKAGHNPLDLFAAHPHRFDMWHIKDMDNTDKKFFTEVGSGVIDFKAIFKKAKQSGMKYFFVEQDICPGNPFDSIAKSIDYLKKNIVRS
ncbi:MAG: sugar phosphate isomerase/epimerase family protein [Chitinophagales bacterium]